MTRKRVRTDGIEAWHARSRVWVYGVIGLMATTLLAFVGVIAMTSGHNEVGQVRTADQVLQQVVDLRTLLAEFQVYAEPHLAATHEAPVDGAALAEGAGIVTSESAQAVKAAKGLASIGLTAMGRDLDAAQATYTDAVTAFTPLLTGGVSNVDVAALAAGERAAYVQIWNVTTQAMTHARHTRDLHVKLGATHLAEGRTRVLVAGGIMALIALCGIAVFGQHAHRGERSERVGARRQEYEAALQQALEMAKAEGAVYTVVGEALHESVPSLEVEMLVADSSRAHFHQSVDTGSDGLVGRVRSGCGVVSPTDCAATIRGHTLVFPTSQAFSVCPYLRGRASGECSAVCVPVSIGGRTVGVTHATGADGVPPSEAEIQYLEISTRRASERIAMLRAFEKSETQARTDPLTGLWNRRSLVSVTRVSRSMTNSSPASTLTLTLPAGNSAELTPHGSASSTAFDFRSATVARTRVSIELSPMFRTGPSPHGISMIRSASEVAPRSPGRRHRSVRLQPVRCSAPPIRASVRSRVGRHLVRVISIRSVTWGCTASVAVELDGIVRVCGPPPRLIETWVGAAGSAD